MSDHWFLIVYDRKRNRQLQLTDYGEDSERAAKAYNEAELANLDKPWLDIVMLGSDSVETLKVTHSTYFEEGMRDILARSFPRALELLEA